MRREEAAALRRAGLQQKAIAAQLGVHVRTVRAYLTQPHSTGRKFA